MTAIETSRPAVDVAPPTESTITIIAYGIPGPQGSKVQRGVRTTKTGKVVANLVESSAKVKPWRAAVKDAATVAVSALPYAQRLRFPLDGPLVAEMVFTMGPQPASRPAWWPKGEAWSRHMHWRPASTPDLSKLLRATEDALTGVVWHDDGRVVEYARLAEYYIGDPAADVLDRAGVVVRVRQIGGAA